MSAVVPFIAPARPALRYHGSKWRIAPWIIEHFPRHTMYVEPFGGGASVLLRKAPSPQEIYNDLDVEIVNVFRVLRDAEQSKKLQELLMLTPHARAEYDLSYEATDDPVESARRTIVRAFMGFNSNAVTSQYKNGFRNKRVGSVGPGHEWLFYPAHVGSFFERMRQVTLECIPAIELIPRYDSPATLFYVDPPYMPETRSAHAKSYRFEMDRADHEALAMTLHAVEGMVLLSGYETELYKRLYCDWNISKKDVKADGGALRTEMLWISPKASEKMRSNQLYLELV